METNNECLIPLILIKLYNSVFSFQASNVYILKLYIKEINNVILWISVYHFVVGENEDLLNNLTILSNKIIKKNTELIILIGKMNYYYTKKISNIFNVPLLWTFMNFNCFKIRSVIFVIVFIDLLKNIFSEFSYCLYILQIFLILKHENSVISEVIFHIKNRNLC